MDGYETTRPVMRRRRKRSQFEIIKEDYLPLAIAGAAAVLILIFIIGSITRGVQKAKLENSNPVPDATDSTSTVIEEATAYAAGYDYENAMAVLEAYDGKTTSQMRDLKKQYKAAAKKLVVWDDNSQIPVLSFGQLIADPVRGFASLNYKSHLTTTEFTKILQKLYENNYILVSLDDISEESTNEAGDVILANKELLLPAGKKPVILMQTEVNYYTHMIDSDGDKFPDQSAPGFGSRLLLDENGNLACEFVDSEGATNTGAYDLVPILESFITTHPNFSYKGARAILAVTGYDGVLGYRTNAGAGDYFGPAYRDKQASLAATIANVLRQSGYEIACNTYANVAYGTADSASVRADLEKWSAEVSPILTDIDILVYAKDSDIADPGETYNGEKFTDLTAQGFRYYIGDQNSGTPWQVLGDTYMRCGQLPVDADTIANNSAWFEGMFDSTVLEAGR